MSENDSSHGVEFPDQNVSLTLTPADIDRMLDGEETVWTGVLPGIKFEMTAEVVEEGDDGTK